MSCKLSQTLLFTLVFVTFGASADGVTVMDELTMRMIDIRQQTVKPVSRPAIGLDTNEYELTQRPDRIAQLTQPAPDANVKIELPQPSSNENRQKASVPTKEKTTEREAPETDVVVEKPKAAPKPVVEAPDVEFGSPDPTPKVAQVAPKTQSETPTKTKSRCVPKQRPVYTRNTYSRIKHRHSKH